MLNCAYLDEMRNPHSRDLFRKLIEAERAAAKVNDIVVRCHLRLQVLHHGIETLFPPLLHLQTSGLPHNAEVLGDIELGGAQSRGDIVHAERLFKQETEDAEAGFLPPGL